MAGLHYTELPTSRRRPLSALHILAPADHGALARLTIRVRPKAPFTALQASVDDIYAKPAGERRYLTRAALAETHGAAAADLDAVENLARENGLTVSSRRDSERTVVVSGTVEALLRVFPADISQCRIGRKSYRGRQGTIGVPSSLAAIVTGVFGYDTRPKQRARITDGAGGVAATVYATRYNFPTAFAGKTLDGAGCCIGMIELGGSFHADDLQAYCRKIERPVPHTICLPPDRAVAAQTPIGDGDGEVMLDVQIAAAIAPAANMVLYFAENQSSGFMQAVSQAVHDSTNNPNVLCISWGGPEGTLDAQAQTAFTEMFTAAAALGMVVCAASGDHGVADMPAASWDNAIHVDHPAADPLVLACGGTQIDARSGKDIVWNDGTPFDITAQTGGWASGGGISTCQAVPAYQQGLAMPPTLDLSKKPGRGVPDLAMVATDHLTILGGVETASRGTSAVAPLMAGLAARLVQAHGGNIGCLNTLLYARPGLCTPVTTGDNGIAGWVEGYHASAGWSACTGLGTPDGTALLQALTTTVES